MIPNRDEPLLETARRLDREPTEHAWSGWPGAFCTVCFAEDISEICATSHAHADLDPERGICVIPCAALQGSCPGTSTLQGGPP